MDDVNGLDRDHSTDGLFDEALEKHERLVVLGGACDLQGGDGIANLMENAKNGPEYHEQWDEAFWALAGAMSKEIGTETVVLVEKILREVGLYE